LVSPTSWSHHWVWIAPALLVVAVRAVRLRSAGWAAAGAVLAATFFLAPFRFLPHEQGQELAWSGAQQLVGATYVIVGVAALVALRLAVVGERTPGAPG
jgi:alpha-1,2-mannosyltransferase